MINTKYFRMFAIFVCTVLLAVAFGHFLAMDGVQDGNSPPTGIGLRPPPFLNSVHAAGLGQTDLSYIIDEAGITAYTKINQTIPLARVQPRFKTIRAQTDQFISGIVLADGYSEYTDSVRAEIHVFVHVDGWIVAYLSRWQIAAEIFDWANYDDKRLTVTLPENVVRLLLLNLNVTDFTVYHYDFRHPNATNLLLVAGHTKSGSDTGPFTITIPRTLTVFESSWSHASNFADTRYATCQHNENALSGSERLGTPLYLRYGVFSPAEFPQGDQQTFSNSVSYCGVAIVYSEEIP